MTTHTLAETLACLAGRESMNTLPEKRYTFAAAEYYTFQRQFRLLSPPSPVFPFLPAACCLLLTISSVSWVLL
jgi:hypothetical protein